MVNASDVQEGIIIDVPRSPEQLPGELWRFAIAICTPGYFIFIYKCDVYKVVSMYL